MKQNYYIKAAIELGVIPDTFGYGLDEFGIIIPDGSLQEITTEIDSKAEYYANLDLVREKRNMLLAQTDWVGFEDIPDSELKTSLRNYRQQLRDITSQVIEGEELNVVWPTDPRMPLFPNISANT